MANPLLSALDPERTVEVSCLSVVVLTHNEEANLPGCLESLRGLCCEIFVVDSGSTDRTLAIARAAGANVAYHPFENYGIQRNWSLTNLPLTSEWVLNLDADERLTPELVEEINDVLRRPPEGVNGFLLRKRTIFLGRWIRHGGHYPSYHLRLFRRGAGRCEDRFYDQHFLVDGPLKTLRHDYLDVITSDLRVWTERHARWAELEAREILAAQQDTDQVRPSRDGNAIEQKRWLRNNLYLRAPLFVRAFLYWIYRYILRLGFLDGKEGLIFHFLQGCWFRFLIDSAVYETRPMRAAKHQTR